MEYLEAEADRNTLALMSPQEIGRNQDGSWGTPARMGQVAEEMSRCDKVRNQVLTSVVGVQEKMLVPRLVQATMGNRVLRYEEAQPDEGLDIVQEEIWT
jgi:hypothetical protein